METPTASGRYLVSDGVVSVRTLEPGDLPFVLDAWVKSYRGLHCSGVLPIREYRRSHRALFERVIRDRATSFVAVNTEESDPAYEILGFFVGEDWDVAPIAHFLYVKFLFRRKNVAGLLLQPFIRRYGHPTHRMWMTTSSSPTISEIAHAYFCHHEVKCHTRNEPIHLKFDPRYLRDPLWKGKQHEDRSGHGHSEQSHATGSGKGQPESLEIDSETWS